jgi:hypothetical protein
VIRAAGWHAGYPGLIPGRDGLYTFECILQRFESASAEILRYIKTIIYFICLFMLTVIFYFQLNPTLQSHRKR